MSIFEALNRSQGITIVMVTHSDEIASYAGRIIRFRDGRIVGDAEVAKRTTGTPEAAMPPAGMAVLK